MTTIILATSVISLIAAWAGATGASVGPGGLQEGDVDSLLNDLRNRNAREFYALPVGLSPDPGLSITGSITTSPADLAIVISWSWSLRSPDGKVTTGAGFQAHDSKTLGFLPLTCESWSPEGFLIGGATLDGEPRIERWTLAAETDTAPAAGFHLAPNRVSLPNLAQALGLVRTGFRSLESEAGDGEVWMLLQQWPSRDIYRVCVGSQVVCGLVASPRQNPGIEGCRDSEVVFESELLDRHNTFVTFEQCDHKVNGYMYVFHCSYEDEGKRLSVALCDSNRDGQLDGKVVYRGSQWRDHGMHLASNFLLGTSDDKVEAKSSSTRDER